MIVEAPDKTRSIWNNMMRRLFGAPASRTAIRNHTRRARALTGSKNQANHLRKVAERNQSRRAMAAASRRRNRS